MPDILFEDQAPKVRVTCRCRTTMTVTVDLGPADAWLSDDPLAEAVEKFDCRSCGRPMILVVTAHASMQTAE